MYTIEECRQWLKNPRINPKTNRAINPEAKNGVAEEIRKACLEYGLIRPEEAVAHSPPPVIGGLLPPRIAVQPELAQEEGLLPARCPVIGGTALLRTTDVEEVPDELLDSLCDFSLLGIITKAKVLRVVDGDTFRLAFFVPLKMLAEVREVVEMRHRVQRRPAIVTSEEHGMMISMKARFTGVDAAEHDTPHGVVAISFLSDIFRRNNNIVWIYLSEFDKYGRILVRIWLDKGKKTELSSVVLGYTHPVLGKLFVPYSGGTKSDYMKKLPLLSDKKGMRDYFDRLPKDEEWRRLAEKFGLI